MSVTKLSKQEFSSGIKAQGCELCGYDICLPALAMHHINPQDKDVGNKWVSMGWARLRKEIEKCIVVCHNCHTEIHNGLHRGLIVLHQQEKVAEERQFQLWD